MDFLNSIAVVDRRSWMTLCVFLGTWILAHVYLRRPSSIPPGPAFVPIIGNLLSFVGNDIMGNLKSLRGKYGDVYSLYFGHHLTIVFNGYDTIHDALVKHGSLFTKRPLSDFQRVVIRDPGLVFSNDKVWREQRRFTQDALQILCFRNKASNLEDIILEETEHLIAKLSEFKDSFDIDNYSKVCVANVIVKILFNERIEFDDDTFNKILKDTHDQGVQVGILTVLVNCFPFLTHFPCDIFGLKRLFAREDRVKRWVNDFVKSLENRISTPTTANSFVNLYKGRIEENTETHNSESFTKDQMISTCIDLIGAGSETTVTSLKWLLLYLIHNPEIQNKMVAEMERVIGKHSLPKLKDKSDLTYCQAVILEGVRMANVAPLAVPHTVSRDVTIRGYLIPENTTIFFNLDSALSDESFWKDSNEFQPERFIDAKTSELSCPKEFIPFGLGPRSCIGETIARAELFLFVTSLVQRFNVKAADPTHLPSLDGELGLTWSPKPFRMRVGKRF